jgi:hypothetical protein
VSDTMDRVLDALERCGCEPTSNGRPGQVKAFCPAHELPTGGHEPSLSVRYDGRKVLLHCFAGCGPEDLLARLGLR